MKQCTLTKNKHTQMLGTSRPAKKIKYLLHKMKKLWATFMVVVGTIMISSTTAFAAGNSGGGGQDIWTWLQTALTDVYNKFLSVSTIAACVAASVCLIMMNFSTDDRAVSSSRAWLKRILISWVVLNVLGFIMTYLVNLTSGGRYIPSVSA